MNDQTKTIISVQNQDKIQTKIFSKDNWGNVEYE